MVFWQSLCNSYLETAIQNHTLSCQNTTPLRWMNCMHPWGLKRALCLSVWRTQKCSLVSGLEIHWVWIVSLGGAGSIFVGKQLAFISASEIKANPWKSNLLCVSGTRESLFPSLPFALFLSHTHKYTLHKSFIWLRPGVGVSLRLLTCFGGTCLDPSSPLCSLSCIRVKVLTACPSAETLQIGVKTVDLSHVSLD